MRNYFYPLSTKDFTFENIFSTESLSPPDFYSRRGFGIDYFYGTPGLSLGHMIILYAAPPKYEVSNATKFILEISESGLDLNALIYLSEGIFGYQKTIYLRKDNFRLHFFSEKERKTVLLQAETSLPTKTVKKYYNNFHIIQEERCRAYQLQIDQEKFANKDMDNAIQLDRRYNSFKGLIYGIAAGLIGAKSKEEIILKKYLQEITNSFAELKNRLDERQRESSKKYPSYKSNVDGTVYINRLQAALAHAEEAFYSFFPDQKITEYQLAQFLTRKFPARLKTFEESQKYIDYLIVNDEILSTNNFAKLKSYYIKQTGNSGSFAHFEALREVIFYYINASRFSNASSANLQNANDRVKNVMFAIDKHLSSIFTEKTVDRKLVLGEITYDFTDNKIAIASGFLSLPNEMVRDIEVTNNAILKYAKFGKGPAPKENILRIIENVGRHFSKTGKPTLLYQYMNNEIDFYSIEKATGLVMKNFVAFTFNPDSLEKLESFIHTKNIEESWIAFSFWCAYNGFANISRNFTRVIFDNDRHEVQDYLDAYLQASLNIMGANPSIVPDGVFIEQKVNEKPPKIVDEPAETNDKVRVFYDQFVQDKYKISIEQFYPLMQIRDADNFIKTLKDEFKTSKKDASKLYHQLAEYFNASSLFN